ncbi:bifunctional GNAT family N-acetyltransferase/hotdog fold thioesterase [Rheinheimera sp. SA_1]|uniref:bifunctional GNAT family N-acetyltransferase/hotdog fold thioesterase n=1 Tax=Rheinheimera sp. SA_1 TaxID=1827365 RepID=UPI000A861852|nr:bifunctional GNAT family N-acetyltransferase/hotdog fold thioesterase [Rheinheimera sp. SA_1]
MKWQLITPATEAQWQGYYQLRYQILRAPWQQPPGSERDELEAQAQHRMIVDAAGEVLAVGRLHLVDADTAQVRYMAVAEAARGTGFGAIMLQALEQQAVLIGAQRVILNARDSAVVFYKKSGYQVGAAQPPLFGIAHWQMSKALYLEGSAADRQSWVQALTQTWQQGIPLSEFMQLQVQSFDGHQLQCKAPLAPNKNPHQTMFAGSIYSMATLTGWGMVFLQMKALGLQGDIVLADAQIRYLAPLQHTPSAKVDLLQLKGDLTPLARGLKVRQQLKVQIMDGDNKVAEFEGRFVVLPLQPAQGHAH